MPFPEFVFNEELDVKLEELFDRTLLLDILLMVVELLNTKLDRLDEEMTVEELVKLRLVLDVVLVFETDVELFELLRPEDTEVGMAIIRSDETKTASPPLDSEIVVGLASPPEMGVTVKV